MTQTLISVFNRSHCLTIDPRFKKNHQNRIELVVKPKPCQVGTAMWVRMLGTMEGMGIVGVGLRATPTTVTPLKVPSMEGLEEGTVRAIQQ